MLWRKILSEIHILHLKAPVPLHIWLAGSTHTLYTQHTPVSSHLFAVQVRLNASVEGQNIA